MNRGLEGIKNWMLEMLLFTVFCTLTTLLLILSEIFGLGLYFNGALEFGTLVLYTTYKFAKANTKGDER